ncbi:MAG: hypothetical protein U0N76_03480, partial [Eubacteriales bacterium]
SVAQSLERDFKNYYFIIQGGEAMCSENEKPDRLIRMLYDIADDAEAPANSRLSAIKEILDRTVGKGVMLGGEQTEVQPVEIVFRIVDDTNFP